MTYVLHPEQSPAWEVFPVDGKGRQDGSPVFVRAKTREGALRAGRYWRKVVNFPKARNLVARKYRPELDPAFCADWRIVRNSTGAVQ